MDTQNIYQDTLKQLESEFQEEAAAFLTETQIDQILQLEKAKITFAEQQNIPLRSWMGNNLRRYCKDLLRRQQPLFALYYLLNICTEASIVLFLCYGIYFLLHTRLSELSFSGIPGIVLTWFCYQEWNRSYCYRCISRNHVSKQGHKYLHFLVPALVISLLSIRFWPFLLSQYHHLNLQNTFLLCVLFLFLSGVHNVLYSSHLLTYFTIGLLSLSKQSKEETEAAVSHYIKNKSTALLAARKKTEAEMMSDPRLYADIHMEIRSRLLTNRIYLLFAILLLAVFAVLCIYQYIQARSLSTLFLGMASIICTGTLAVFFISCNELIRRVTPK